MGGKNAIPSFGRKRIFAKRSNHISKTLPFFLFDVFEKRLQSYLLIIFSKN
jgi:hypothetical protein